MVLCFMRMYWANDYNILSANNWSGKGSLLLLLRV